MKWNVIHQSSQIKKLVRFNNKTKCVDFLCFFLFLVQKNIEKVNKKHICLKCDSKQK